MRTKALFLFALGSVGMLSADQYSSCPGGNCPYQGQSSGQPYYQGSPQQNNQQSSNQAPRVDQDKDGYYTPSSTSNSNSSSNSNNNNSSTNRLNLNNSNNSSYVNDDKNAPKATKAISDEEITEKVHDAISANWLSSAYRDVTFDVKNGTVNLRGYVKTQEEKTKLENALKKIDGVRQVNSEVALQKK